jgi:hypothetical protein
MLTVITNLSTRLSRVTRRGPQGPFPRGYELRR